MAIFILGKMSVELIFNKMCLVFIDFHSYLAYYFLKTSRNFTQGIIQTFWENILNQTLAIFIPDKMSFIIISHSIFHASYRIRHLIKRTFLVIPSRAHWKRRVRVIHKTWIKIGIGNWDAGVTSLGVNIMQWQGFCDMTWT